MGDRYASTTVDPRWSAQLAEAEIAVWWPNELTAVHACAGRHCGEWADFVIQALELLHELSCLPSLQTLIPIPGTAVPTRSSPRPEADERIGTGLEHATHVPRLRRTGRADR